jgi:DnaJ-class molecular chaperone
MNKIECECSECGGTGLYHGFMEQQGEYVVCVRCGGTGKRTISYKPFTKRNRRNNVSRVRFGSDDVKKDQWVSYKDFLNKIKEE